MSYSFTWMGSDRIEVGNTGLPASGTLSLAFRTGPSYNPAAGDAVFFYILNTVSNFFHIITALVTSGDWVAGWFITPNDYRVITTSGVPAANSAWTHLLLTWNDVANETKLYLNNVQVGATVTSLITMVLTNLRMIGGGGSTTSCGSKVAEVAIWNAVASPADRAALASWSSPTSVMMANRVNYWPLRVDAKDVWGSDHGTVIGATVNREHPFYFPTRVRMAVQQRMR